MKRTIQIEFPDDFEFPEYFDPEKVKMRECKTEDGICENCPLHQESYDFNFELRGTVRNEWCALEGYDYIADGIHNVKCNRDPWRERDNIWRCPFFGGAKSISL